MQYINKPKFRIVTLVTFIFGLLLTRALYDSKIHDAYWIITLAGSIIICGGRAIITERSESSPETMKEKKESIISVPGIALLGLLATAFIGLYQALETGDSIGLIASSISFGVLAVVSFMK